MSEPTADQPLTDPPEGTPGSDNAAPPGVAGSAADIEIVPLHDDPQDDGDGESENTA